MAIPTSSYYEIEVNTASDFTGTVMWDSDKTAMTTTTAGQTSPELSYTGSTLNYATTYYWRIRFWDMNDNVSPWSDVATFRLNRQGTAPTNLLAEGQTNPIRITDTTPEFSAIYNDPDTADAASYYEIEVNTASDFTGTVMWDSGQTTMTTTSVGSRSPDISYAGGILNDNTTYYWRIRFWDSGNVATPWSSNGTFLLNSTPTAPTELQAEALTNPIKVVDTTPEFTAIFNDPNITDEAPYYEIEVNTNPDFTGTVMWDSGKIPFTTNVPEGNRCSEISYAGSSLNNGTKYYWRIKFWDLQDAESPWSSTANFIMTGSPTASSLLTCGDTNPSYINFTLTFSSIYSDPNSDNSSNYEIEVNTLSDFTGTVMWDTGKTLTTITSGNRSPEFEYSGTSLSHDSTIYYVRMRFWDTDDNASDWVTGQFTDTLKSFQFNGLQMNGLQLN
jgi:hypothetical protein